MRATKSVLLAIAMALCAFYVSTADEFGVTSSSRSLLGIPPVEQVKASCRTKAKATLFISDGTARVKAVSSCSAFASSINGIEEIWRDYIKQIQLQTNQTCTVVRLQDIVDLCAQSVAKVYVSAQAEIDIKGTGEACALATADGDAFAKSFAFVFVNMWLGVTDGLTVAEADAQVAALTFALAKVWAEAKVKVCQKNTGTVEDAQESYAAQIRLGIACVFAEVAVKLCKHYYKGEDKDGAVCAACEGGELEKFFVATESSAEVESCSKTTTIVDVAEGNAGTEDRNPVPCDGRKNKCCGEFYADKKVCLCGKGCIFNLYEEGIWENSKSKKLCFCENFKKPEEIKH